MKKHVILLACGLVGLAWVVSQAAEPQGEKKPLPKGFPDLVAALKTSPGCVGVETARTAGGKNVIFAWFEDKKSVVKWYYSDVHKGLMKEYFPSDEYPRPLREVKDDAGPIMVIASVTFAEKGLGKVQLPFSQIAIELYQPLPGGAFIGAPFAPKDLKVPNRRDYTPKEAKD